MQLFSGLVDNFEYCSMHFKNVKIIELKGQLGVFTFAIHNNNNNNNTEENYEVYFVHSNLNFYFLRNLTQHLIYPPFFSTQDGVLFISRCYQIFTRLNRKKANSVNLSRSISELWINKVSVQFHDLERKTVLFLINKQEI